MLCLQDYIHFLLLETKRAATCSLLIPNTQTFREVELHSHALYLLTNKRCSTLLQTAGQFKFLNHTKLTTHNSSTQQETSQPTYFERQEKHLQFLVSP